MPSYKIRSISKGLYVKGTPVYRSYDTNGRLFNSLGALRTFLTNVMGYNKSGYYSQDMSDWEVVEYELVMQEVKPLHEIIKPEKLIQLLKQ
jgi:hypothetical protein